MTSVSYLFSLLLAVSFQQGLAQLGRGLGRGFGGGLERCKPGWNPMQLGFRRESVCMAIPEEKATFTEAMTYCEHIDGARLVEIRNPMVNNNLKTLITSLKPGGKYWIGLWDVEMEGTFTWVHEKFAFYQAFAPGKGRRDLGKNCVYMDQNGSWYDESCSARLNFICMKK